jgi:hypothetical protein
MVQHLLRCGARTRLGPAAARAAYERGRDAVVNTSPSLQHGHSREDAIRDSTALSRRTTPIGMDDQFWRHGQSKIMVAAAVTEVNPVFSV